MRIVRLTNPEAFSRPEVQRLFERAFEENPLVNWEDAKEEMTRVALDPNVNILIGAEEGRLKALSIGCLPVSTLSPNPTAYYFFNRGSAKLRKALINATVDFFLQAGYTRFWASNLTGVSDEAYARLFKGAGTAERVCSLLEFKIG